MATTNTNFKVKNGLDASGVVTSAGLSLLSTTSPITLNGSAGTSGQILTSAGAGLTPTWSSSFSGFLSTTNTGRTGNISFITPGASSQATWAGYPVGLGTMVSTNQSANGTPTNNFQYFLKVANRDFAGGWGGISIDYATGDFYVGRASDSANYATWHRMANTALANTFTGTQTVISSASNLVPLVSRGAASQVEDLLELQSSAGTVLGGINALGQLYSGTTTPINYQVGGTPTATSGTGSIATINLTSASNLAVGDLITVTGFTPTAYNTTGYALVTAVSNTPTFSVSYASTATGSMTVAGQVQTVPQASITARSAATVPLIVKGGGFNMNLQTWLKSDGNPGIIVNPYGSLVGSASANQFNSDNGANFILRTAGTADQRGNHYQVINSSSTILAGFNGQGQIFTGSTTPIQGSTTVAINTQTPTGTTNITITTAAAHGILVGQTVVIAGITPSGYNGTWTAQSGTTGSTLVVNIGSNPGAITVAGTVTQNSQVGITALSANNTPLVVRGAASQAANLLEVQSSTGSVLTRIASSGQIVSDQLTYIGSGATSISNGRFNVATGSASVVGAIIRGAASQTANLQEWQNSAGTRLFSVSSSGLPYLSSTSAANIDMYSEAGGDMALMLPADDWDDKLRFLYGLYETSTDGSTNWTVGTFDASIVDGRMDTMMTLPSASLGHRWTWFTTNFQYMTPRFLRLSTGYPGASASTISVLIESSANNSTWTTRGTYTGISAGIMKRLLRVNDNNDHSYIRVTITYTAVVNPVQLENIELLTYRPGNQGGNVAGAESRLPFSAWNGNRTAAVQANNSGSVSFVARQGISRSASISNAVGDGTTVTYTTVSPHVFRVGQSISITGVNPSAYNISGTVASVTGMSGFTVTNSATGTYVSGGTAVITTTASIQEWQDNNNNVLLFVGSGGQLRAGTSITGTGWAINNQVYGASVIPLLVRGATSQTANLQEWQDSASTALSYIKPDGSLYINSNSNVTGIYWKGTASDQSMRANGNDLFITPRFDLIYQPTDTTGRLRPANDNQADLGTSGQRWKNLYAVGAILNGLTLSGASSPITLNGSVGTSGQVLTSAGAGATPTWTTVSGGSFTGGTLTSDLVLAAGSTTVEPLTFQSNSSTPTTTSGAMDYDGTVFYQTSNTNPGRALSTQSYYYASSSDYAPDFSASGSVQSMLGGPTIGITVAAGTTYEYEFYATVQHQYITNAGLTGTYQITSTTVSGSPTVAVVHQIDYGSNTTNFTTATTLSTIRTTTSVVFSAAISSGSRYNFLRAKGVIRVTGTGTTKIYPGLSLSGVAGDNIWNIQNGLVFKLTPIGNGTVTTVGAWA